MTKILQWIGVVACITLIVSCFFPWAYYDDVHQTFTGLYSYRNEYGRPGKLLIPFAVLSLIFLLLPKVWAKRTNMFLCALLVGYTIKTFVMFTSCYNAYCPQKLWGIYAMLIASAVMLLAAIFPHLKMNKK